MNITETAFLAENPLFGGLANYLDKKELLQDFAEKIANLEIMKRVRLEEHHQVFEELKLIRLKRLTLMQLYLKIARCVYYCASIHRRLRELYFSVTPDFFRENEIPIQVREVFHALYFMVTGEAVDWDSLVGFLQAEELIPKLASLKVEDITLEKSLYFRENYLQNAEFKSSIAVLPANFSFVRVLSEWMVAQVLFKEYPAQMKEIDELILKVSDEKSGLENDETQLRNQVLEIASHIDSLKMRSLQLQEEVELALREENARESIKGHLRNDFEGDFDISEILTRQMTVEEPRELKMPSTIELALGGVPERGTLLRKLSSSVDEKLPTTFKLDTIQSKNPGDESPTFRSISQGSTKKASKKPTLPLRKSSDSKGFNQRLHDELEQMKRNLLEDYNKDKPELKECSSGNVDDFYLRYITNTEEQARPEPDEPATPRRATNKTISFVPEFDTIDVLSLSDNVSVNKQTKSPDDSQILGKNFLMETGFSKFDALIKKGGTGQMQAAAMGSKNTLLLTPQVSNNYQNINDFSILMTSNLEKKTTSHIDFIVTNEVVRKMNDKINTDAYFLERLDKETPLATPRHSQHESQKQMTQSVMTYGRSSSSPNSEFSSEILVAAQKESVRAKFTSFKGPQAGESGFDWNAVSGPRDSRASWGPRDSGNPLGDIHGFTGITEDQITAALDKHKMYKKKGLDLTGIIDGYFEWKFEEFKAKNFRFPELQFIRKVAIASQRAVERMSQTPQDRSKYAQTSKRNVSLPKADRNKLVDFKVISYVPAYPKISPLPGLHSSAYRPDTSPGFNQSSINDSTRGSNQTHTRTSPESLIHQSTFNKSFYETPQSKPVSFKQIAGNQKLPSMIFQNAVHKQDRSGRGSANAGESSVKVSNLNSPFGSGVKFVNAPVISFHKGPQTPNLKTGASYLTPTIKGQPVGELWPKIFENTHHSYVTNMPSNIPVNALRNSFNEIVLDTPDLGSGLARDISPCKAQIRDSRSTACGNSRSIGDRSPATMMVNGREAWLVKTDKEGSIYRYK
jgi:hypothetical protein